jgi:glycopeptide antibiotics resistance protein
LGRSFDIDDLICNFVGIMIGFLLARLIGTRCRSVS